ncbi:hypothetical protein [Kluyvera cryocrescens]|uniref:hypothetical protein n=1 Tax=Kluyvera cryocrescens TaxID=580 RepID=UPI0028AB6E10|nr:hypothetical protein [Kluyvera cryocrescens]
MPDTIERTDLSVSVRGAAVAGASIRDSISTRVSRSKEIKIEFLTKIRRTALEIITLEIFWQNIIVYQSHHYVRNSICTI